jgi:ribosomal protein S11
MNIIKKWIYKKKVAKFKKQSVNKIKTLLKNKNYITKSKYFKILKLENTKQKIDFFINIKIMKNNFFCTLKNKEKTLILISSGKLKIKVSKRKLKAASKIIIKRFIYIIKKTIRGKNSLLTISGQIKTTKQVIKQLISGLNKCKIILNIKDKKCFNGCRPKKKRRKKGIKMRIKK